MIWPDSLSEWLVEGAGLQQVFCCLTSSTARALFYYESDKTQLPFGPGAALSVSRCVSVSQAACVPLVYRLLGLVVKVTALETKRLGFDSRFRHGCFPGPVIQTSDLKMGTPVAALPGAWRYRVSVGTGCMMFHSRPVHSLMFSSRRFLCLHLRLPPSTVPCRTVLASLVSLLRSN